MMPRTQRSRILAAGAALAAGLACWQFVGAQDKPTSAPAAADAKQAQLKERQVRQLIDRYFRSWSDQNMQGYGQCFMPQAAVQLIEADGSLTTVPLGPFLQSQLAAHRAAQHRLSETAETVDVRFESKLARVVVYWKLVDGPRVEYGYDHFTLMQSGGEWKIANLIFYGAKGGAGAP